MKVFSIVVGLLVVCAVSGQQDQCTNGQVYETCGSACPFTCATKDDPPKPCPLICVQGCFCPSGLYTTDDGRCVQKEECPPNSKACANNMIHETCGTACPLTCANKDNPGPCDDECVDGCFCPSGMVLNGDACVKPSDCPDTKVCANNMIHETCGTACPLTCANKDNPGPCDDECVDGCFCPSGMVLNGNTCVQPSDCPDTKVCANNMIHETCGSACPLTCANKDNPPPCIDECVDGCFCPSGMVANGNTCVQPSDCPDTKVCTNGMVHSVCGSACPLTCANKDNPPSCIEECVDGCFCPSGMVANGNTCVQPEDCPDTKVCTNGMVHSVCGSACPLTCANKDNPPTCIEECVDGCFCPSGMVANGNTCIQPNDCPVLLDEQSFDVPSFDVPYECPETDPNGMGVCVNDDVCLEGGSEDCGDGRLCCSNGCGSVCMDGVTPSPLCAAVRENTLNQSEGLLGVWVPECEDDGSFSTVQCNEGQCWCVDGDTGEASSEPGYGEPNCLGTPAFCNLEPVIGPCKAAVPSFFYNATSNKCEAFKYGGCQGNDNRFSTHQECVDTCGDETTPTLASVEAALTELSFCPTVSAEVFGACIVTCTSADDCEDGEMCCSNGCGHTCTAPVSVPYYTPPMSCPYVDMIIPGCLNLHFGCTGHDECDEGQLCCTGACGDTCMDADMPDSPCNAIKESVESKGLIGAYTPQCEDDGSFSNVQCHASTGRCWCADTETGKPLAAPVMFAQPDCNVQNECDGIQCDWPQCPDDIQPITDSDHCCPYCPTSCTVNGVEYASGATFSDDCNTCTCYNGMAACTEMACLSSCKAGGMEMYEGEERNDGCSVCTCTDKVISCSDAEAGCTTPIYRSIDVSMKFNGDYDTVAADMTGFKDGVRSFFVDKYSASHKLQEAQISNVDVSRGSVIVVVTFDDTPDLEESANVTLLLIQLEQDYSDQSLVIIYQDVQLEPVDDFTYSDNDGSAEEDRETYFWTLYSLSAIIGILVFIIIVIVALVIVIRKKKNTFRHHRLRSSSSFENDYELNVKVKGGLPNPTYREKL